VLLAAHPQKTYSWAYMAKSLQRTAVLSAYHLVCPFQYFTKQSTFPFPQERATLAAATDPYRYVEKRKPIPDPQVATSTLC
jgi:hypothetical protein